MQSTRSSFLLILLASRAVAFLAVGFGVTGAHAGIKSERVLAAIIQHTPASVLVEHGQQMKCAERAATAIPGAEVFWGVGESMEPLYVTHTAVVVAPIRYTELRQGMTVIYLNHAGRMVAHALTGELSGGWIAQGVNSEEEDDDLVTGDNLVGVIVQAYSEIQSGFRVALARRLIANGKLPASQS